MSDILQDGATTAATALDVPIEVPDEVSDEVSCDIRCLDAETVRTAMLSARADANTAEAQMLALAVHYVDLHPLPDGHGFPDNPVDQPLAGPGTPTIDAFAVAELGAVLQIPFTTAWRLLADSIAVCYRLPRVWERVHTGNVTAWQARTAAHETTTVAPPLPPAAVEFVDRQLAILIDRRRWPSPTKLKDLIHEAACRYDPDHERGREEAHSAHRGVWFDHQTSTDSAATTSMTAVLDAWDALDLDAAITDLAHTMTRLGDTTPHGPRRAAALVLLAHPQRALDLHHHPATDTDTHPATGASTETGTGAPSKTRRRGTDRIGSRITLYVHTSLTDLVTATRTNPRNPGSPGSTGEGAGGCALIEDLGPALLDLVRDWAGRTDQITIRPVLDPTTTSTSAGAGTGTGATGLPAAAPRTGVQVTLDPTATTPVDQHDPPPAMRDLVILRDGACVFPGCRTDARHCDLDHIEPWLDPATGGPPDQTHPDNLAALCRRHHRLKTHTAWTYQPLPTDHPHPRSDTRSSYRWTSPWQQAFTTSSLPPRGPTSTHP